MPSTENFNCNITEFRLTPANENDRFMLEKRRNDVEQSMLTSVPLQAAMPDPRMIVPLNSMLISDLLLSSSNVVANFVDGCSRLFFNQPSTEYSTGFVPCKCCKTNCRPTGARRSKN